MANSAKATYSSKTESLLLLNKQQVGSTVWFSEDDFSQALSLSFNESSEGVTRRSQKLSAQSNRSSQTGGFCANSDKSGGGGSGSNKNVSLEPKENKPKKGTSISRQNKFYRHFPKVDSDEKVINYFSCALVSDILLHGQLYITNNYFAFYSNVIGYVTKLLIPTGSVVKISKETTAKIFPNAVGVQTAEERHVFRSFISRDAAYRLMLSVCNPVASIEDDTSSVSGNESPPRNSTGSNINKSSISTKCVNNGEDGGGGGGGAFDTSNIDDVDSGKVDSGASSGTSLKHKNDLNSSSTKISSTTKYPANVSPSPNKISNTLINKNTSNNRSSLSNKILSLKSKFNFKFPTDVHIVYVGVILAVILSLFSGFLLYKIQDIQARTSGYSSLDFKIKGGKDVDVYAEILRWQKEMQSKNAEEAQMILASNLEQIARMRQSLQPLSNLIHDNNSPYFRQSGPSSPSPSDDAPNET